MSRWKEPGKSQSLSSFGDGQLIEVGGTLLGLDEDSEIHLTSLG